MNKIQEILDNIGTRFKTNLDVQNISARKKIYVFNAEGELLYEYFRYEECAKFHRWQKIKESMKNKSIVNGLFFTNEKLFNPIKVVNKPKICPPKLKTIVFVGSDKFEFDSMTKASKHFGVHKDMFSDFKSGPKQGIIPKKLSRMGVTEIHFVESEN